MATPKPSSRCLCSHWWGDHPDEGKCVKAGCGCLAFRPEWVEDEPEESR